MWQEQIYLAENMQSFLFIIKKITRNKTVKPKEHSASYANEVLPSVPRC